MARDQWQLLHQPIKTPNTASVMNHQVEDHRRIDEVIINEETEVIPDERLVHMCEVVGDHEQDAERTADSDHEPRDQ
jgi:hypothetical protein